MIRATATKRRSNGGAQGFSLIEMLVVLAIVSVTTAIAFSSFHARQAGAALDNTIRDVGHLAQMVRMEAINRGMDRTLHIDVQSKIIADDDGRRHIAVPTAATLEVVTGKELIRSASEATIVFFADGSSSGGAISLSNEGSPKVTLRIPWLTGIPTIIAGTDDGV